MKDGGTLTKLTLTNTCSLTQVDSVCKGKLLVEVWKRTRRTEFKPIEETKKKKQKVNKTGNQF